jgi:hypothetical protein
VERGTPPLSRDTRLVPWDRIGEIDAGALAVRLNVDGSDLDEVPELDAGQRTEDGGTDLVRDSAPPPELLGPVSPRAGAGPVDRPSFAGAIALGAAGLLSLLAVVIFLTAREDADWKVALFVVPAVLFAAAGILAYRVWRRPYEVGAPPRG